VDEEASGRGAVHGHECNDAHDDDAHEEGEGPEGATEVLVSPDMRHACVRVHIGGGEGEQEAALQALDGARHYLRRQLAGRLSLFRVPALHFEADLSLETETRVEQLLKRIAEVGLGQVQLVNGG